MSTCVSAFLLIAFGILGIDICKIRVVSKREVEE